MKGRKAQGEGWDSGIMRIKRVEEFLISKSAEIFLTKATSYVKIDTNQGTDKKSKKEMGAMPK